MEVGGNASHAGRGKPPHSLRVFFDQRSTTSRSEKMRNTIRGGLPVFLCLGVLTLTTGGSTAHAQQRNDSRNSRRPSYSSRERSAALTNQMLSMFNAQQSRNWALVNNGRSSSPIYSGVRTANPFSGTTDRTPPKAPNYSGGYRGNWSNPYNGGRDNNVYGPSPYNGKSRYVWDPNWRKSSR